MILRLSTISSAKISAPKFRGICPTLLLSLTLLFGLFSAPRLNCNQLRQSVPTELISRPSSSPRRTVAFRFFKKHFQFLFFLSCQEIVKRLLLYDLRVMVEHSENLNPEALGKKLQMQLLALTLNNSKSSDSYVVRG